MESIEDCNVVIIITCSHPCCILVADLPNCSGGDRLRLICMGKGILMPDSRTLEDCEVPVFKTHPTPINVAVRPENLGPSSSKGGGETKRRLGGGTSGGNSGGPSSNQTGTGCGCTIM